MKLARLLRDLAAGKVVALSPAAWEKLAAEFEELERHRTGLAGDLVIVRRQDRLAAVEQADPKTRAVRPLASPAAARDFVRERLAAYDRLWDG